MINRKNLLPQFSIKTFYFARAKRPIFSLGPLALPKASSAGLKKAQQKYLSAPLIAVQTKTPAANKLSAFLSAL